MSNHTKDLSYSTIFAILPVNYEGAGRKRACQLGILTVLCNGTSATLIYKRQIQSTPAVTSSTRVVIPTAYDRKLMGTSTNDSINLGSQLPTRLHYSRTLSHIIMTIFNTVGDSPHVGEALCVPLLRQPAATMLDPRTRAGPWATAFVWLVHIILAPHEEEMPEAVHTRASAPLRAAASAPPRSGPIGVYSRARSVHACTFAGCYLLPPRRLISRRSSR